MKKWPSLEEIIAIMPQHAHIKEQVTWCGSVYDFEGWTTLGDTSLVIHCAQRLTFNDTETQRWYKSNAA